MRPRSSKVGGGYFRGGEAYPSIRAREASGVGRATYGPARAYVFGGRASLWGGGRYPLTSAHAGLRWVRPPTCSASPPALYFFGSGLIV